MKRLADTLGATPPRALRPLGPAALTALAEAIEDAAAREREELENGLRKAVRVAPLPFRPIVKAILRA